MVSGIDAGSSGLIAGICLWGESMHKTDPSPSIMVSHLVTKPLDSSQSPINGPCPCIYSFLTLVTLSFHIALVLPSSLHMLSSFLVLSEESVVHCDISLCHRIFNYINLVVLASYLFCVLVWDFVSCSFINTLLDLLYPCSPFISPVVHVHVSVSSKWYVYITQFSGIPLTLHKISWSCATLCNFFDISIWWNFTLRFAA